MSRVSNQFDNQDCQNNQSFHSINSIVLTSHKARKTTKKGLFICLFVFEAENSLFISFSVREKEKERFLLESKFSFIFSKLISFNIFPRL